jgi:ribosomal-protein-serine acetyltransferase
MAGMDVTWDGPPVARERPFAVAIVVWRTGASGREFLLLHRVAPGGPDYEGDWAWTPPAGARQPGESPDAAAARELKEESGLALSLAALPHASASDDVALYLAQAPPNAEVVVDDEHDRFLWVTLADALPKCLPSVVASGLANAAARIGMETSVSRADADDVGSVVRLLDEAAEWQQDQGIDMWRTGTFEAEVREAVTEGDLYVAQRDGEVIGCFMLEDACPEWMATWLTDHERSPAEAMYLGRLAVARAVSGHGLGIELLADARELATRAGFAFLRLNCPAGNERLRRYYLDAGFEDLAQVEVLGPENQDWTCTIFEASLPRIDTEVKGLRLVSLGPGQVDEYYQLVDRNREHVTRHGDYEELGTATRESVLADLQDDPDGAARFGIRFKGTLIGRVDLVPRDPGNYVLGYWLDQTQTGNGFATAACRALINDTRGTRAISIWAGVTKGNERSAKVLGHLGFEAVEDMGTYTRYRLGPVESP